MTQDNFPSMNQLEARFTPINRKKKKETGQFDFRGGVNIRLIAKRGKGPLARLEVRVGRHDCGDS